MLSFLENLFQIFQINIVTPLLQEVFLLELLDLADAEELLLVAGQGLSHGKLVLVLRAGSLVWGPAMDITDSQLLPAWGQMRRAVLQEETRAVR